MRLTGLLLLSSLFLVKLSQSQPPQYDPNHLYSQQALKSDLHFLREKLQKIHPGLYRYTTKPSMDQFFDSLDHAITGPMTEQSFLNLLTLLNGKIRNGHTMFLPSDSAMSYFYRSRHLPFLIHSQQGKLTIAENYSSDSTILPGTEIVTINGTNTSSIIAQLSVREVRDGYNETYPAWILNQYFSSRYSFTFGDQNIFTLEIKDKAGETHTINVPSLTRDSIHYFRQTRYASRYPPDEGQGIIFQQDQQKQNAAVLKIKSFDPDQLLSIYHQDYKKVFDSIFTIINHNPIDNLILDLRDNQGGDFPVGRMLLSYIVLHPCQFLLNGPEMRLIQPRASHFKGKLFVLLNGGTFSSAAIVCACLKGRAHFIGEESGGNAHVISGDPIELVLPHTRIKAEISTVIYWIAAGPNDGHGVMPDYPSTSPIEAPYLRLN